MADEIDTKSIGILIDELITTSLKCWFKQEVICNSSDTAAIAEAAKAAQALNARRNALIRAIDKRKGETNLTPTSKTYV